MTHNLWYIEYTISVSVFFRTSWRTCNQSWVETWKNLLWRCSNQPLTLMHGLYTKPCLWVNFYWYWTNVMLHVLNESVDIEKWEKSNWFAVKQNYFLPCFKFYLFWIWYVVMNLSFEFGDRHTPKKAIKPVIVFF